MVCKICKSKKMRQYQAVLNRIFYICPICKWEVAELLDWKEVEEKQLLGQKNENS